MIMSGVSRRYRSTLYSVVYPLPPWIRTASIATSNAVSLANNFAILADGSLHCLPVTRRNEAAPGRILTNPSLARGKRMLFNGHISVNDGVVTSIGMSGRIHKLATEGDAKFVNPIPILEAWGFEMSPNLTLRFEGSRAAPPVDANTHVIG